MEQDLRHQRHRQLLPAEGAVLDPQRPEIAGRHGADEFGECGSSEARQRGVRHQQNRAESSDPRTRGGLWPAGARERHCARQPWWRVPPCSRAIA